MTLRARPRRVPPFLILRLALAIVLLPAAGAATLPPQFTETQVASGLASPTAMAVAPDGRIFVAEQGGKLRVIKNGTLLATPFVSLTVSSVGERGLLDEDRSEEHTSELQSRLHLVCRLLLEKKKT